MAVQTGGTTSSPSHLNSPDLSAKIQAILRRPMLRSCDPLPEHRGAFCTRQSDADWKETHPADAHELGGILTPYGTA
jgi:hypothetical protein